MRARGDGAASCLDTENDGRKDYFGRGGETGRSGGRLALTVADIDGRREKRPNGTPAFLDVDDVLETEESPPPLSPSYA